jgi:hypothetical protein
VSKNSKYGFGKFSKDISTRATNITNSENDDNCSSIGPEGLKMSSEKSLKSKQNARRGHSVLKKQTKMLKEPAPRKKYQVPNKNTINVDLEEDKIEEDIQESNGYKLSKSKVKSSKQTPIKHDEFQSSINPDIASLHSKTETLMNHKIDKSEFDASQSAQDCILISGTKMGVGK